MKSYIPNIQRITAIQISKNFDMSSYHEATVCTIQDSLHTCISVNRW